MDRKCRRKCRADALREQPQAGRAAGEKKRVDLTGCQAGLPRGVMGSGHDAVDVGVDRLDRVSLGQHHVQCVLDQTQVDACIAAGSNVDLGRLGACGKLVAEAMRQHEHQAAVVCRVGVVAAHATQF